MTKELKQHNPQARFPTLVVEEIIKGYDVEELETGLSDSMKRDPQEE
jgi:hypothetical protein